MKPSSLKRTFSLLFFLLLFGSVYSENLTTDNELAKNIRARILEDGFSIEITWTPPEAEGEIIVGRSKERIDTPEKLYYADSLGRFPNRGENKLSSLKDMNLKPGVYYYAVAMVSRIKKRDVILVPNQNYTYDPIDIGQPVQIIKLGKNEILPYAHDNTKSVSDIEVKTYKDYNQVRWVHPLNAENTKPTYYLYRSEEPLSSIPLMKQAKKIVEVKYPDNFYVDKDIEQGKIYYYGVSVFIQGEEFIPLVEHKSFIRTAYSISPIETKNPTETTVNKDNQACVIPQEIRVEKSNVLEVAKQEIKEGSKKEVPVKEIVIKSNVESKPNQKQSKLEESHVQDINFEFRGEGIFLTWAAPNDAIPYATLYSIYLFYNFPKNPEKLIEQGKAIKLGEVIHPDMSFSIPKIDRKRAVYIAVSVKHGNDKELMNFVLEESLLKIEPEKENLVKEEPKFSYDENESKKINKEENTNLTAEPNKNEDLQKSKKNSNILEFEQIMQEYKKKKYEKAKNLFDKFAQKEQIPEIKAKALFYSALCDYNLGNYEKSLNKLLQKDLRDFYDSERVDFYINRCIERK